ncbi:sel1 repeat family protein [Herbaspirillum sp. RV1423]|uniref:SEL1-like repeat protein n=1 Tax=Herbaspirillum sp. RV1423 TaxID=1443993 RepID=UPI0009DECB9A|nr:sel1 repeat family protein [Herbaspirillum sp. RV1423]
MRIYPCLHLITLLLASSFLLTACSKEKPVPAVPDTTALRANLAFTCAKEADRLPALNPDADQLFKYARWLDKQPGEKHYDEMARYYRIAAAHGHYKANSNLQKLVSQGQVESPNPSRETVLLAQQLIDAGIPGGYYDMARYLELGYGVKRSHQNALTYYRKAADLGSPEAQYYVAEQLAPIDIAPEIAMQMWKCAADQGHGEAAQALGINLKIDKHYAEAAQAFQKAVAAGNTESALKLEDSFKGVLPSDTLDYLALPEDLERSRRYKLIGQLIDRNESKNPKVPDIDQIVPLPPAKLPHWDGTFQWQKEQDAAVPPAKPDEKLVERLANDKRLDPTTGLLIPREPLGTKIKTGAACPESGVWRYTDHHCDHEQIAVRKGDPMPSILRYYTRTYAWMPNLVEDLLYNVLPKDPHTLDVTWTLIGYPETKQA